MVALVQTARRHSFMRWGLLLFVAVLFLEVRPSVARAASDSSAGEMSFYRDRVVVLSFHDVQPQPATAWSMTPAKFEKTLTFLRQIGFRFISPAEFADFMQNKASLPANALMVTFDDGLEDVYRYAFPVLQRLQIPCLENVIGSRIGTSSTALTALQLQEMVDSGLVWIGGHSYALHQDETVGTAKVPSVLVLHHNENDFLRMVRLQSDATHLQQVIRDDTGAATPFYACPYGSYDEVYLSTLYDAGFQYVFNSQPGAVTVDSDPLRLPRVDIGHQEYSLFQMAMFIRCAVLGNQQPLWQAGSLVRSDQDVPEQPGGITAGGLTASLPANSATP